jgi:hypothetical protein
MINLIPQSAKKSIKIEYWLRVITVWGILMTGALIASIFIMAPAYVLINLQIDASAASSAAASEKIATYESVTKDLARSNAEAKAILDTTEYVPISTYIDMIRSIEGENITVSEVTVSRSKTTFAPIQIKGEAVDRQSLSRFRDGLLANPAVAGVDLPISNLAKDKEIQFNLSVSLKNPTP